MSQIRELIRQHGNLPALPEVVHRINQKLQDPDSSLDSIAQLIATDPVLTGKIIKISNSALFSTGTREITNLTIAISRLGLNEIRNIVLSHSLLSLFDDHLLFDPMGFWKHCLSVAFISQSLARVLKMDMSVQNKAYMAGLMHDIGIVVFGYIAPDSYKTFLKRISGSDARRNDMRLEIQENQSFGFNHAEVGAMYITVWWELDEEVAYATRTHHNMYPDARELPLLNQIVMCADRYANKLDVTSGIKLYKEPFSPDYYDYLNMNVQQIDKFQDMADINVEIAELLLSN